MRLDYLANFQNFWKFLFYMGPHNVDFPFAFDTTLIRLKMTKIWPEYVAQAFLPHPTPPRNRQLISPGDRVKVQWSLVIFCHKSNNKEPSWFLWGVLPKTSCSGLCLCLVCVLRRFPGGLLIRLAVNHFSFSYDTKLGINSTEEH